MQDQPNYYAVIPASVRYDEHLADKAKLLYGEIAALTNRNGFCWAFNDYLARRFKVSKRAISKYVTQLQRRKHIHVEILNGNRRRIWVAHPTKALPSTNKCSWGVEQLCVGDGTVVPPLYNIKENNKEEHNSESPRSGILQKSKHHPQRKAFIALWSAAYEDFFGVPYKVQNGKDGKAADGLFTLKGVSQEELIELARKSWDRREEFNCKHAVSLAGFAARFNEIRAEVGLIHNRGKTKGF